MTTGNVGPLRGLDDHQLQERARAAYSAHGTRAAYVSLQRHKPWRLWGICLSHTLTAAETAPSLPQKRSRVAVAYDSQFSTVAGSHRPQNSQQASKLFDVVLLAEPMPHHFHLVKGVLALMMDHPQSACRDYAVRALLAMYLAMHLGVRMVSVVEGSLVFKLCIPRETVVAVRARARQRLRQLSSLGIRCLGFLISNQIELDRLDEDNGRYIIPSAINF